MAKARTEVPPAGAIRAVLDGEGWLAVKVTPGARVELLEIAEGRLLAKVRAKAKDGEANDAVRDLLAKALGIGRSRVVLAKGATSRDKLFRIEGG